MKDLNKADSPGFCGVGGPLFCLFTGLTGKSDSFVRFSLCPLFAPLFLLLTLICPPLLALVVFRSFEKKRGINVVTLFERFKEHAPYYLLATVLWWAFIYFGVQLMIWRQGILFEIYAEKARAHRVLQLATPEQLEYSRGLMLMFSIAGALFLAALAVIFNYVISKTMHQKQALIFALKGFLVNAPGYLLLIAVALCVFTMTERYYATLVMRNLEAIINGTDGFNPGLLFIVIRLWLGGGFVIALCLMAMGVKRLLRVSPQKRDL